MSFPFGAKVRKRFMLCYMCWAGCFQYSSETNENSSLSPGISPIKFGFLKFNFREYATEEEHLRHRETQQINETEMRILELSKQGHSCRKIAEETGLSKSTVNNIIKRNKEQLSTVQQTPIPDGQMDSGQKILPPND